MSEPIIIDDSLEVNSILKTTQTIRKEIVKVMVKNGYPEDRRDIRLLMEVMRDMDVTALTSEKNLIEKESQGIAAKVSENVTQVLKILGRNAFTATEIEGVSKKISKDELLPDITITPSLLKTDIDDIDVEIK